MPLPNFSGSTPPPPPPPPHRRILYTNGGSLCQAFAIVAETVKIERGRNHAFFCEENLGKIEVRAFPKRVSPRILSLESVEYFATSENY